MKAHWTALAATGIALSLSVGGVAMAANASGYKLLDRIAGGDGGWDYAAVDAANGRVLVGRGTNVMAVNLATRAVTESFAKGDGIHAALPINGGTEVLITNGRANTATIVDGRTGALLATLPTGKNPDAATYDAFTGLILVMDHSSGEITEIDPKTRKVVATVTVGGDLEAAAVDGAGKAYVNVEDKGEIVVVDIRAAKALAHYKLVGCEGPTGIAYAPADKLLITTCDGVADVVSAATGKLVKAIKIGDGADGVAFDATHKLAFVPSGGSGTLSIISIANGTATLVDTVKTQTRARTIALDQRTGRVYLPTAKFGPRPAGGGRAAMTPGSFELLVLGK
jgi:YVTN family beta-propeller protein